MRTRKPAINIKKHSGRPTITESEANPFSPANIRKAATLGGYVFQDQIDKAVADVEQIEDPYDRMIARAKLTDTFGQFFMKKMGQEESLHHKIEITVNPMLLGKQDAPKIKNISKSGDVIDV